MKKNCPETLEYSSHQNFTKYQQKFQSIQKKV